MQGGGHNHDGSLNPLLIGAPNLVHDFLHSLLISAVALRPRCAHVHFQNPCQRDSFGNVVGA